MSHDPARDHASPQPCSKKHLFTARHGERGDGAFRRGDCSKNLRAGTPGVPSSDASESAVTARGDADGGLMIALDRERARDLDGGRLDASGARKRTGAGKCVRHDLVIPDRIPAIKLFHRFVEKKSAEKCDRLLDMPEHRSPDRPNLIALAETGSTRKRKSCKSAVLGRSGQMQLDSQEIQGRLPGQIQGSESVVEMIASRHCDPSIRISIGKASSGSRFVKKTWVRPVRINRDPSMIRSNQNCNSVGYNLVSVPVKRSPGSCKPDRTADRARQAPQAAMTGPRADRCRRPSYQVHGPCSGHSAPLQHAARSREKRSRKPRGRGSRSRSARPEQLRSLP
jgi:hypothetical protein